MSKHVVSAAGEATPAEGHKSRRAALGLFAGLPALAILPAAALAASPTDADAEILALSLEIQRLAAISEEIRAKLVEPFETEFQNIIHGRGDGVTTDSMEAAFAYSRECGREAAVHEQYALDARIDPMFDRMMAIPATTNAGRAAKVRALLMHLMGDDWRGEAAGLDWDVQQMRALLGEFTGMSAEELAAI